MFGLLGMSIGFTPPNETIWAIIAGLCIAGILDTIYVLRFTFAPSPTADPEAACRIDDPGHCQTLFQSETARLIGNIPNSALGFVFYVVVGLSAVSSAMGLGFPIWWNGALILGALAAVAMSVYLLHHLLVVRKTTCIPCFIGQGINLILLGLLILMVVRQYAVISWMG